LKNANSFSFKVVLAEEMSYGLSSNYSKKQGRQGRCVKDSLKMSSIFELRLFVCIARHASLSAAARTLDVSPAAASFALKRLEERLRTRLFARTTRNLRLTDEGARYLMCVESALEVLDEGENALLQRLGEISGVIQIAAPCDLGRHLLLPCLDEVKAQYPGLVIHLLISDKPRDLYREPIDLFLRFGIPKESDLIALPVWDDNYRVACASPAYLERHGTISHPENLLSHNCITYHLEGKHYDLWTFSRGDEHIEIKARGDHRCDDGDIVRRWALEGYGVVFKSWIDVASDIKAGRLRHLLPEWRGVHAPLYLMCPHRMQVTKTVKLLHTLLKERCKKLLLEQ
jgi:DNA-binding transcriptional LysR family regulator